MLLGQMSKLLKRKRKIKRESVHAEISDATSHNSTQRNITINPLRLQYVILRTKSLNRCDSCKYIYTYTDFAIEIWGFYRCITDTLRYHHTRCSRASGLQLAAILQHVYQWKKSGVYSELSAVFGELWKITIVGPSSIHRLAVKVKLVDSLI